MPLSRRSLSTNCLPVGLFAKFNSCLQDHLADSNDEQNTKIYNVNESIAACKEFRMNLNESIDHLNDKQQQFFKDPKCE